MNEPLTFKRLSVQSLERCEATYFPLKEWSPTDWACAMAGECGEACNLVKKLRRGASPIPTIHEIRKEVADMVIYADLLAQRLGFDLGIAIREKFNETSGKVGSDVLL